MALCLKLTVCIGFIFGCCTGDPENLSLLKPASISTQYFSNVASYANDGNIIANMNSGTCAHSQLESNPWWTVDLGEIFTVDKVRIFNREDVISCVGYYYSDVNGVGTTGCLLDTDDHPSGGGNSNIGLLCSKRLVGFRVHLSNALSSRYQVLCYESKERTLPLIIDFNCKTPVSGRFLTVSLRRRDYLTLCEVQVFEKIPEMVANIGAFQTTEIGIASADGTPAGFMPGDSTHVTEYTIVDSSTLIPSSRHTIDENNLRGSTFSPSDTEEMGTSSNYHIYGGTTFVTNTSWYSNSGSCPCLGRHCSLWTPINVTKEAFIKSIMDNLEIDQRNISRERNRYVSVPDERPSAQAMGSAGIVFIVLVFGSIVLIDVIDLLRYLMTKRCPKTSKA